MRLVGLEEHWCPRELFESEKSSGYQGLASMKAMQTPEEFEHASMVLLNIGEERIRMI